MRLGEYPQGVQLVANGALPGDELGGVGAVQTVHAVHPENPRLVPPNVVITVTVASNCLVAVGKEKGGVMERMRMRREGNQACCLLAYPLG